MRSWHHIRSAPTTWLILLTMYCCTSCERPALTLVARPVVASSVDSAWKAIRAERFTEGTRQYVERVLNQQQPLSDIEKLLKYELDHWYYTTFLHGDFAAADLVADSALALFAESTFRAQNLHSYALWMLFKGDALVHLKQLDEAFTYYYQVKTEYLTNWNACNLSQFTARLGYVRQKQENHRDAIRYYLEAFRQFLYCQKTTPSRSYYEAVTEPQGLLNAIAWNYELLNLPDSALQYYHRALNFVADESLRFPLHEKGTSIAKAVIYGNLGGLYNKLGKYDTAVHYLTQSVTINSQDNYDQRDVQTAQIKLADTYLNLGRFADAARLLAACRKGLDSLPSEDYEIRWRHTQWLYYEKQGMTPQAYTSLRSYHTYKDSVETSRQSMFLSDFQREFERQEQQQAYIDLTHKSQQNFVAFLMSIIALMLVMAVVYLIFSNWKRSKKHIERLNDLTERINSRNIKLQLALLALQDSQQENTRIMAMVAHDLRNPLTNIQMAVSHLMETPNRSDVHTFLEIINKSNEEALTLINEFLHSYGADTVAGANDHIDLDIMLHDCIDIMQLRASRKGQTLRVEGEPASIRGSREKIWRVISNLIDNAIKFTPQGGEIVVRLRNRDREVIIEVQDSGVGIPPEFEPHLFEMSDLPSRRGTNGEPSTGLGLAIVKQIVSAHCGRIHFTSTPNAGTTFYVHLPH